MPWSPPLLTVEALVPGTWASGPWPSAPDPRLSGDPGVASRPPASRASGEEPPRAVWSELGSEPREPPASHHGQQKRAPASLSLDQSWEPGSGTRSVRWGQQGAAPGL